jgi:hypothetical protein
MKTQHLDFPRFVLVAHDQRATLDRRDVLVRVKAEDADVAEAADALAAPGRSDGQRRVLYYAQFVLRRQRVDGVHVARQSREMRGQDGARTRTDARGDRGEVEIARAGFDIDEYRCRADPHDHVRRGEESHRGRDHLVAGPDAAYAESQFQRCSRGRHATHVTAAGVLGKGGLERLEFRAAGDPART